MDTATKRYSAINISCPWRGILPLPDGDIDAGDRQIVPYLYSGILAAEPAPEPAPEPRPQAPDAGGVGRVYAPTRRRKPERLVFLEKELIEQLQRAKELERKVEAAAAVPSMDAAPAQLAIVRAGIADLERAIAHELELRDDEDAMQVILRTLH